MMATFEGNVNYEGNKIESCLFKDYFSKISFFATYVKNLSLFLPSCACISREICNSCKLKFCFRQNSAQEKTGKFKQKVCEWKEQVLKTISGPVPSCKRNPPSLRRILRVLQG